MLKSLVLSSVLLATLTAGTASANHLERRGFNPLQLRVEALQFDVVRGLRSGALTPREIRRIRFEQAKLAHRMAFALADGYLSRRELFRLNRLLDRDTALLDMLLNNRERRFVGAVMLPRARPVVERMPAFPHRHMVRRVTWYHAS